MKNNWGYRKSRRLKRLNSSKDLKKNSLWDNNKKSRRQRKNLKLFKKNKKSSKQRKFDWKNWLACKMRKRKEKNRRDSNLKEDLKKSRTKIIWGNKIIRNLKKIKTLKIDKILKMINKPRILKEKRKVKIWKRQKKVKSKSAKIKKEMLKTNTMMRM